jgi:hypothetical protein
MTIEEDRRVDEEEYKSSERKVHQRNEWKKVHK